MSDDPQPAARVEDTVQHSQARIGRGLGALGGAALAIGVLVLAGALEIGSMGLATPVVVGLGALAIGGVGAAMSAGSNLGADAGRQFMHDDGKIASGIPTILIGPERRFAAHINSNVNCDDHKHLTGGPWPDVVNAGQEQISEGSATVLLGPGMMPAARVGSQGTCEFTIGSGCPTVIIGGPTLRLGPVGEDGRSDDPDKGFFDSVGQASGWIGIAGAALVLWPLGVTAMVAGGAGAWLVGQAAGPVLNLLPEGAPRDAAALALAVLPLALLPGMARGLSPNEGLKIGKGETPEGFAARVKAAKNARAEAEWRAKVQASKPRAGEIPLRNGLPIPAYARATGAARAIFDEGGGVFSPKKGSNVLQMAADDAAAGGGKGWSPKPPARPKPGFNDPNAAEWRYQRYLHDQYKAGKGPDDVLSFDDWKAKHFDTAQAGGRPGRRGGPDQVRTKEYLTQNEGVQEVENVELGGHFPDGVRDNAQGGKDYFEVGKMLKKGVPESRESAKLAEELKALGPNDTMTFVDKMDPTNRVNYKPGDTVGKTVGTSNQGASGDPIQDP